jgi:hypothetical protein
MLQQGSFGVKIIFKGGSLDYIDPVSIGGLTENQNEYRVDNGFHVFVFEKSEVEEVVKYEICSACGHEKESDGWCSSDCTDCADV